jgi:GNAT superfamily N-acetyltransferase
MSKPLLIFTPAPARWPAVEKLFSELPPPLLADLEARFTRELPGAQDAFAVIPDGGQVLACAAINRRDGVGVLGYVYTRPEHRGQGYVRDLLAVALSWFDMTGGRWLYAFGPRALGQSMADFCFQVRHCGLADGHETISLLRRSSHAPEEPFPATPEGAEPQVRDLTRADWPLLVALLQHRAGPDPRVPAGESAVGAEHFALDLVSQAERGACLLKGAFVDHTLISAGVVATDRPTAQTYGLLMPCDAAQPALREALVAAAKVKGYEGVEFPMEALGATPKV